MLVKRTCLFLMLCLSASAQTVFEAVTIKPSIPMAEAMPLLAAGKMKVGISVDKSHVDMGFVTLTDLITKAYKLTPMQVSGPDWLAMERFDLQAKLPDGSAGDQVPDMIRAMLADRFGMRAHMESRERSAYALIVGKDGPKLAPSTFADEEPVNGPISLTPSKGGTVTAHGGPTGPMQMTPGPNGVQIVFLKAKISSMADFLSSIFEKPVVDRTGLTGDYQITLDVPQEDVRNVQRALGIGGPVAPAGTAADPAGSSMFQAVEKFGLKLDSRKENIETLAIDHIEKLPTAN